jgi:hypothetical protein
VCGGYAAVKKIEALADAIVLNNGSLDPNNFLYFLRNPGALKAFIQRHERDERGYRIFDSFADGYRALVNDLKVKCGGRSTFGVGPQTPIKDALFLFNINRIEGVMDHLKIVIGEEVDEHMALGFFAEVE